MSRSNNKKPKKRHPPSSKDLKPLTTFNEMKGRTVERIDVCLSPDYHSVSVRFEDKTDFTVEIDTRLTLTALHADWKTGNMRVLRRWPVMEE